MTSTASPRSFRRIVWAAFYCSFLALLLDWERDLGWSKTDHLFGLVKKT